MASLKSYLQDDTKLDLQANEKLIRDFALNVNFGFSFGQKNALWP